MKTLAIIPARKGSKRIKNKNIKLFMGKPLICWTIEEALKCKKIDEIYISTNCNKIKKLVYNRYKIKILRMRPDKLSNDNAKMIQVLKDVLNNIQNKYENIILLQPTSPLRKLEDINKSINLFNKTKASSLVSITKLVSPFYLSKIIKLNKKMIVSKNENKINYCNNYVRNGRAILITKTANVFNNNIYGNKTIGYTMPFERSIDINTNEDFELALKLKKINI